MKMLNKVPDSLNTWVLLDDTLLNLNDITGVWYEDENATLGPQIRIIFQSGSEIIADGNRATRIWKAIVEILLKSTRVHKRS